MNVRESREHLKQDLQKEPEELETEAEDARVHMADTLDAIQRRFSPGEMVDQVLRVVRENGTGFGRNLATQVRNNPLPAVLAGAGLIWLAAASKSPPSARVQFGEREFRGFETDLRQGAADHPAEDDIGERVHGIADRARGAAERARGAIQGAAERLHTTREGVSRSVHAGADQWRRGSRFLTEEQPLLLGALAVAAGAVLGSLLPPTRTEDRLLGRYRDNAAERVRSAVGEQAERVREAASRTAEDSRGRDESRMRDESRFRGAPEGERARSEQSEVRPDSRGTGPMEEFRDFHP